MAQTATAEQVSTGPASYEHEGFSVSSNSGTMEDLQRDLGVSTADQTTSPETHADPGDEDPESLSQPEKLKAGDVHKRIAKTTYEREEAKREAETVARERDEARAELARIKAERERPAERDEPRRTEDEAKRYEAWKSGQDERDPKPSVAEFEDHDAYLDARDAWNERRIDRRREREQQEQQQHERQGRIREAATKFQSRMDAEVAKDEGFKQVLERVQIPQGPILDVFLSTDIPEAMARYLDANPQQLAQMIQMPRGYQLAEIKRIEGYLQAQIEHRGKAAQAGSAAPVKTTQAHPPINPVVGSHVAVSDEMPGDDATDAEYYAWEKRQSRAKR